MNKHAINVPGFKRCDQSETASSIGQGLELVVAGPSPRAGCDFRDGCRIILDLLLNRPEQEQAWATLREKPLHLAETLLRLGLTRTPTAAVDLARAIQELRTCPPANCACSALLRGYSSVV